MLDSHPRTQLCLMLKQYGQTIMDEPKRCKGLLSDLAPQHRLENYLLITALEQKIVQELLTPNTLMPIDIQLERLAQSLQDAIGIEENYAYWAVESWALALNVIQQPIAKQPVHAELIATSVPSPTVPHVKQTQSPRVLVFSVLWLIAGIFIISVFAFSSRAKQGNDMTKPPAIAELPKKTDPIEDIDVDEPMDAWTQNNLGDMYYYGRDGVTEDYQQAAQWYRKAAEQGSMAGQCNLGFMYANGYGVTKDYQQATQWYRKAAEQGSADGQNNLGVMYENGYGVEKDSQQAEQWYRRAVEQGHYGAQQALKRLLEKL